MPRRSVPDPMSAQVGARIRALRLEKAMSLAALADAAEVSKGHLSTIEHGLAAITVRTVDRIAAGLNILPMYLLAFPAEDERANVAELLRSMPIADVKKLRRDIQGQIAGRGVDAPKRKSRTADPQQPGSGPHN